MNSIEQMLRDAREALEGVDGNVRYKASIRLGNRTMPKEIIPVLEAFLEMRAALREIKESVRKAGEIIGEP